ncbi:LANO_0E10506g1_1 [Lachancea nothofagi CBS 11611]|uniref:LANO_0E10506g1_1 n=1 Tax=Lachancea nothofagi CBS 11611 TaxID=1266666 RepID=A0A1G4JWQ8_9SACH|nr:LANO_0E10506g1_1 [Lachancea nothofagi CBS 11611]
MSADCSVGSNPLSGLSKHAQQDRSLHHGGNFGQNQSSNKQFKLNENKISDANKMRMEAFMGNDRVENHMMMGNGRAMLPPTLPDLQRHQQPQQVRQHQYPSNDWSQQFNRGSPEISSVSQHSNVSAHSPQIVSAIPQEGGQMMRSRTTMSRFGPGSTSAMFSPGVQNQALNRQQFSSPQNLSESINQESWDEQFKELEKEVAEKLALHEEVVAQQESETVNAEQTVADDQYQAEFQEVWDNLHEEAVDNNTQDDWQRDYQQYTSGRPLESIPYKFESENQYLHNSNAYEIGCILMENGAKLSEAALAFEAAVQENPKHVDAWLKLGMVHTQNEMEYSGISALEECLGLDPHNLDGMVTLAISYINEGYDVSAFKMLNRWLETKYPNLVSPNEALDSSIDRYSMSQAITLRFLQVVNKLPEVDASLQLGLGILFYSNDDYDKTVDCFKAALAVSPNDELMWNRLGASLANSNRSEEAVQAYRKALQLKPTFVRARCNLAVSCMNMGCYKEAAEYLLTALSMHEVEGLLPSETNASQNLLETLKRAFIGMERRDLLEEVRPNMNLSSFRKEFTF